MLGQETELLVQFVSEQGTRRTSILGVTLTLADKIVNAVISITVLWAGPVVRIYTMFIPHYLTLFFQL